MAEGWGSVMRQANRNFSVTGIQVVYRERTITREHLLTMGFLLSLLHSARRTLTEVWALGLPRMSRKSSQENNGVQVFPGPQLRAEKGRRVKDQTNILPSEATYSILPSDLMTTEVGRVKVDKYLSGILHPADYDWSDWKSTLVPSHAQKHFGWFTLIRNIALTLTLPLLSAAFDCSHHQPDQQSPPYQHVCL